MRRSTARAAQALIGAALLLPVLTAPAVADPSTWVRGGSTSASTRAGGLPTPAVVPGVPRTPPVSPALAAAQAAAAVLSAKVAALQTATEVAVEHYNEVAAELTVARRGHLTAVAELRAARARQARADRIADERLRELYITGGPPGLLDLTIGTSPGMDVFHTFDDARFFVSEDRKRFAAAAAAGAASAAAERVMAATLATKQRLTREAAAAQRAVTRKLAAETKLLASASAQVQAVLAAERRAQTAVTEALAARIRAEQRRTGSPGVALAAGTTLTPFVNRVLAAAETELGKPYRWGATGPGSFDCSGLVQHVFAAAGVALPRTSRQQWYAGAHPANDDIRPGDLLFWADGDHPASIHHVAVYLGSGYMIAAPHTGALVRVQPVYDGGFFGVTRVAAPSGR